MKEGKKLKEITNVKALYDFIGATHLQINGNYNECVELRALARDKEYPYCLRNLKFYNHNEKQLESLKKQVDSLNAQQIPFCFYYSVYSFNPNEKRVTKENAQRTQMLCADFDHIDQANFDKVLESLKNKGLEPNFSIFSGHGYQIAYILKEASADKELLHTFTTAMIANGFPVDSTIKDCARIMRLPYTFNSKDPNDQIETYVYKQHAGAYDLKDIWQKLGIEMPIETQEDIAAEAPEPAEEIDNMFFDDDVLLMAYGETRINLIRCPEPIKSMLMGFRNGKSNEMTKALVLYFRDYEGMTKKEILKIFEAMKNVNHFNYTGNRFQTIEGEVTKLFNNRNYRFNYNSVRDYGNVEVLERYNYGNITILYNDLFKAETYDSKSKSYKPISNKAFIIYLRLVCDQTRTGFKSYAMEDIERICNKSSRRLVSRIKELCKAGLIDKKRSDKKTGEKYLYTINSLKINEGNGFTKINNVALQAILKCLDDGELNETSVKFLLFIKKLMDCGGTEVLEIDQQTIGKALNISRTGAIEMWKKIKTCSIVFITRQAAFVDISARGKICYCYTIHF